MKRVHAGRKRTKPLRRIGAARIIEPSPGTSIRTRLRLSARDEQVLGKLGTHISRLSGQDLSRALRGDLTMAERKKLLTAESSARWAGSITRRTDALVALSRRNLAAEIDDKRAAIAKITERLALPSDKGGYARGAERHGKTLRREVLRVRLATCEARLAPGGHLSIVRGGRHLLGLRHHLDEARISPARWREDWEAARSIISANGSHDELGGNLTIRVAPDGTCSILLPEPLRHLANAGDHYRLDASVAFPYRQADWLAQLGAGAINYTIRRERYNRTPAMRWYLDASWIDAEVAAGRREERRERKAAREARAAAPTPVPIPVPTPTPARTFSLRRFTDPAMSPYPPTARPRRSLGVDLNADHLAVWVLDASGNPVARPYRVELRLAGLPTATRDGRLRSAISEILAIAARAGATVIFIEDLGWEDEKGREHHGHRKRFRHLISSFPTTIFRSRLVAMAARADITVVAVDPAYTSMWGTSHWARLTSTAKHPTTGHEAAALAIGRRGLSLRLNRRTRGIRRDRSDPVGCGNASVQSTGASRSLSPGVSGDPCGGPARPGPLGG